MDVLQHQLSISNREGREGSCENSELINNHIREFNEKIDRMVDPVLILRHIVQLLGYCFSVKELRPLTLVVFTFLLLNLQGCHMMHRPSFDEDNGFRQSVTTIGPAEAENRRREMMYLLQNPSGSTNHALLTGISDPQRDRIMSHFSELFENVQREDFDEFMRVCIQAKVLLGIMNFDRYDPLVLRTVVQNFLQVELDNHKSAVIVFIARSDEATVGDIQPLNVEAYQIGRLLEGYKVFLFECSSLNEINYQINTLVARGLIRPGKVKGFVNGAHGSPQTSSTGITIDTLRVLASLSYFFEAEPILLFPSCYSGAGREHGINFVNVAWLLFSRDPRLRPIVIGCDGLLVEAEFDLDDHHLVILDSIVLGSFANIFTLDLWDDTYRVDSEHVLIDFFGLLRVACDPEVPDELIRSSIEQGIYNNYTINLLQKKNIPAQRYQEYLEALRQQGVTMGSYAVVDCLKYDIPAESVKAYNSLNPQENLESIFAAEKIIRYHLGITAEYKTASEEVFRYAPLDLLISLQQRNISIADLNLLKECDQVLYSQQFISLLDRGVTVDRFLHFFQLGVHGSYDIEQLLDHHIDETIVAEYQLFGVTGVYGMTRLSEQNIFPAQLGSLRNAGFNLSEIYSTFFLYGVSVDACLAYAGAGVLDFRQIRTLIHSNIPPQTVAVGFANGKDFNDILMDQFSRRNR